MGMDYSLVQRIIDGLGKILDTKPGSPDEGTYVTEQQLADWIKGQTVVPAYYYNGVMYSDALHTTPITGQAGALYIDQDNNVLYRWDGAAWDAMSDNQLRQDILDGTVVAKKAECDEDGNNIKATYATKVEMQAADTNLNDAIAQHEARIENLEEAHGSYHEVDVKSVYTIPTGKGSNWLIDGLRGVSRADNQMIPDAEIHQQVTSTDTSWHFTSPDNYNLPLISGHRYLFILKGTGMPTWGLRENGGSQLQPSATPNAFFDCTETGMYGLRYKGDGASTYDCYVYFKDVTVYFNGTIPTDADTISKIQTNYPWLLTPSDYGTSAVNTVYEWVVSIGVNIWDEETQVGNIDFDNAGNDITDSTRLRSGFIPCLPSTTYYCKCSITDIRFGFYDMNENYLGSATKIDNVGNTSFTTPSGAYFMRFRLASSYGVTYKHDIQLCLNSYADKTTYHPYFKRTLTFPSPVSLKSAGAVADTMEPCVEVKVGNDWVDKRRQTQRIDSVTIGSLTWSDSSYFDGCFEASINGFLANYGSVLCAYYLMVTSGSAFVDKTIYCRNNGTSIYVKDSAYNSASAFKTAMSDVPIFYEKATPVETLSDPILDNLIATEAGGTIESILTTPVDDSMTLGYINL